VREFPVRVKCATLPWHTLMAALERKAAPVKTEQWRAGPMANADIDAAAGARDTLRERVEAALRTVYDPEIPVNIYELGLIYDIDVSGDGAVAVRMTLTTPHCPAAAAMPGEVEARIREIEGVTDASVELVWDPPWDPSRMSDAARLELGLM